MRDDQVGVEVSKSTLPKLLKSIGFIFKSVDKRVHLTERQNLVEWRRKYIQFLNNNESLPSPKPVIYLDESWIDCYATATKGWAPMVTKTKRDKLHYSLNSKCGKGPRLIMLHAGSKDGFVNGALLLKDSKTTDEDYHKEMDGFGFKKWFQKCLLPNIPANSIIVMDNASYHSATTIPKCNSKVKDMKDWLQKNNIQFSPSLKKKFVWELVKKQKTNHEHFIMDRIARDAGHEVLRLHPYHCNLNPIELVWAHVKGYVAKHNSSGKVSDVKLVAQQYMAAYSHQTWNANVAHVKKIANEYQRMDGFSELPPSPGQFVISTELDSSDSEDALSTDDSDSCGTDLSDTESSEDEIDHRIPKDLCRRKQNITPKTLF